MAIEIIAAVLFVALLFYSLTGGADFGAGIWDLFSGKRHKQHEIVSVAIRPIWEADHVWLIMVVVILFSAFPSAFYFLSIALNIPLSIMLLGIVLRGIAFTFRNYGSQGKEQQKWRHIFAGASIFTPVVLGMIIGSISSGNLKLSQNADFWTAYMAPWLTPYCIISGFFALSLFAFLSAAYLAVDAHGEQVIQERFRRWSILSNVIVFAIGTLMIFNSRIGAPRIWQWFHQGNWHIAVETLFCLSSVVVLMCLFTRHFKIARIAAAVEVSSALIGFASAQFPYLVTPNLSIYTCASSNIVLNYLICALAVGAVTLFPSLFILFHIFKGTGKHGTLATPLDEGIQ